MNANRRFESVVEWTETNRQQGWFLLEVLMALSVLTVGVLGFLFAFQKNFTVSRDLSNHDLAVAALSNGMEQLDRADFATLYAKFNNTFITLTSGTGMPSSNVTTIGRLTDPAGNPARVFVTFHVNETNLPSDYGPVRDIDGDGALISINCSTTYKLLPAHLSITYQTSAGVATSDLYVVLGRRS